ncbi:MAG: hypothetical protein RMN51_01960 [Verrucomicrobiota bacterium]|nr:hypothetical protein [Limisphaera sp.]MDW8380863.1 hypothetical protein [Verrucomicrobiota bacterium]
MAEVAHWENLARSWLELAEQETEAIQREDWQALAKCQERIGALQRQWETFAQETRVGGSDARAIQQSPVIRDLVSALIERERHNLKLLEERRAALQVEMERWADVAHRIRQWYRIQPGSGRPGWMQFS